MSKSNLQIITQALRELGLIAENESPTANQGTTGLEYLNQMMAEWTQTDHDLDFAPQDTLSDTCPIPDYSEAAVISNLAVLLAPPMGMPIPPIVAAKADQCLRILMRTMMRLKIKEVDLSYLPSEAWWHSHNIQTDI